MDNPNTCETCKHFKAHYIKTSQGYRVLPEGHCMHPRVKGRQRSTPACQRYAAPAPKKTKTPEGP